MPRTARLDAPGVFHHVMIRGIERRNIFRNKIDREDFLQRLGKLLPETRLLATAGLSYPARPLPFHNRQYALKALGYDLQRIAGRVALLLGIEDAEIFSFGRRNAKVKARSLVCFWAAGELGMSLSDLARAFAISIPGTSYAVRRSPCSGQQFQTEGLNFLIF